MFKKKPLRLRKPKKSVLVKSSTFSSRVYDLSIEFGIKMFRKFSRGIKYLSKAAWFIQVALLDESLVLTLGISALIFAKRKIIREKTGIDIWRSVSRCSLYYVAKKIVFVFIGLG